MKGILVACIVDKITTLKDKSVKITLDTQELKASNAGELFTLLNSLCTVYISPAEVTSREMAQVDAVEPEMQGKSPSQRMRTVLFLLWKQDNEGFKVFDMYYQGKMEKYIEELKQNLPPQH
jgi:hypothetical protein